MNVIFETAVLAPGQAQAACNVRLNGRQVTDEAEFFRALNPFFFPRGNVAIEFSFEVNWIFNTTTLAEVFVMTLPTYLPMTPSDNGVLQVICGAESSPQTVYSPSAVLESADVVEYIGRSVRVRYVLKCSPFTSTVPPNVPAYPSGNQVTLVFQRGTNSISANATQLAISFSTPFASTPIVVAVMGQQTGSRAIFCRILQDTVTVNGFTVEFSDNLPDGSSVVNWWAVQ